MECIQLKDFSQETKELHKLKITFAKNFCNIKTIYFLWGKR